MLGVLDASISSWWIYDVTLDEVRAIRSGELLEKYPRVTECPPMARCAVGIWRFD